MLVVVVVGRSGAGKSTFIEAMGLDEYHCVLSQPMIEEVRRRGQPVDHDHIHSLAKEWYAANEWWQVEYLLDWAKGKPLVLVDGLRYPRELARLRELYPDLLVVKVATTVEDRFCRLKRRRKVPLANIDQFKQLEQDESADMGIEEVLAATDLTVENVGTVEELEQKAIRLSNLLKRVL